MLNRLFVIIGFLVILAIGAAFILPRFIQWGDYRARLETMATDAFGTPVAIRGDISLALLPQPQLVITDVTAGPETAPVLTVARVEASFSLFDFLTDRYAVTRLVLERPALTFAVGADGALTSGLVLGQGVGQSNVSIRNATVTGGSIQLSDARSGEAHGLADVAGELRLDALSGPFGFQGTATQDGAVYNIRVSTGQMDADGATSLALGVQAADRSFNLEATGVLETGASPRYVGDLRYRVPPPAPAEGQVVDAGRGDLLLEGKFEADTNRALLSNYVLLPDENRAATRLTGAADLKLGAGMAFNAVVSGGVVGLPPRDATKELTEPPYEIIRLLGEMPLPPVPAVPGRVGLDITELNLRGISLRDVQLDATTDGQTWLIETLSASLVGSTRLNLSGTLGAADGHSAFSGQATITSEQPDRLAALWRRPLSDNPLLGVTGALNASVELTNDSLALTDAKLTLGDYSLPFDARVGFGPPRDLTLSARIESLSAGQSGMVAALMPDIVASGSFGATFPKGAVALTADSAVLFGQEGRGLGLEATWDGGVLTVERLRAEDFGGAAADLKFTAFGTLLDPQISGSGSLKIGERSPLLRALMSAASGPIGVTAFLERSLPIDLAVTLDAPTGDGNQALGLVGMIGTAQGSVNAQLSKGIANALSAAVAATVTLDSSNAAAMTAQLGLGSEPLFASDVPMHFEMSIDGLPSESYQVRALLSGGNDHASFDGRVVPGDFTEVSGSGSVDVALSDPSVLAEAIGATGLFVPSVTGKAQLEFRGTDSLLLDDITGAGIAGQLSLVRTAGKANVTGSLQLAALEVQALLPTLGGASATIPGTGLWPEGPIDIGDGRRATEGRVDVTASVVAAGGQPFLTDARFALDWTADSISLRNFTGAAGEGSLTFDATVCCGSPTITARQVSGRLSLTRMPLDIVVPATVGGALDGEIDAAAQFTATADTLAGAVAGLSGSGSYTVRDFAIDGLDAQVFNAVGGLPNVLDTPPESLAVSVLTELSDGSFRSGPFTGSFTIAGGVLRSPNLAIAGDGARLFGNGSINLRDLALGARFVLTPTIIADAASLVDAVTAEIVAAISGPLWAPIVELDVSALVDGMKIRASEIELAALEQARLEEEARQAELAAERARIAAEQAAAEEARRASEEARRASEEAAASQPPPPLDLGL